MSLADITFGLDEAPANMNRAIMRREQRWLASHIHPEGRDAGGAAAPSPADLDGTYAGQGDGFTIADVQNFVDLRLLAGDDVPTSINKAKEKFQLQDLSVSPVGIVASQDLGIDAPSIGGGDQQAGGDMDVAFKQIDPESGSDTDPRKYLGGPEMAMTS